MRNTRLTRRGRAAITVAVMLFGFTLGTTSAMGDDPCGFVSVHLAGCP